MTSNAARPSKELTAYISETRDREMNTMFLASICDDKEESVIAESSGYDRDDLVLELEKKYPGIKIENE
jgi:hypothetical protein